MGSNIDREQSCEITFKRKSPCFKSFILNIVLYIGVFILKLFSDPIQVQFRNIIHIFALLDEALRTFLIIQLKYVGLYVFKENLF